jgi:hypothetical protein
MDMTVVAAVLEYSPNPTLVADSDGRCVYANRALRKISAIGANEGSGGNGEFPIRIPVLFWGAWCCMSNGKGAPHPRACSHQHYAGWLCRIASSSARDAERKRGMEAHQDANLEIPKHSGLAGSSRDQVQSRTHARIQALRLCRHHHCRSRATTLYSQRPIRPRTLTPQRPRCARYLERCPRCIDQSFSRTLLCPSKIFAPEPKSDRYHKHVMPLYSFP